MTPRNTIVVSWCLFAAIIWFPDHCLAGKPTSGKKQGLSSIDRLHRAGNPQRVAWYAIPSINKHYSADYIGGGATIGGHERLPDEGTWGLDFSGRLLKRHTWLRWWHGRREQDGGGTYKTDGPHLKLH